MSSAKVLSQTTAGPVSNRRNRKRMSPNDDPLPTVSNTSQSTAPAPNDRPFKYIDTTIGGTEPENEVEIPITEEFAPNAEAEDREVGEGSENGDDEITQMELDVEQKRLDSGAKALAARQNAPMKIPDEIRKMNRELSRHVRQWWKDGKVPMNQTAIFDKSEMKVDKICQELAKEDFKRELEQEVAKQIQAGRMASDDEEAKAQLKKDFWLHGTRENRKNGSKIVGTKDYEHKWKFFYFEEPTSKNEAKPGIWTIRWKSYAEYFRFPRLEVSGHIKSLGLMVRHLEALKEEIKSLEVEEVTEDIETEKVVTKKSREQLNKEIAQAEKKIIEGALVFTSTLESYQLEPQLLIPDQYKLLFSDLVNASNETKNTHQQFLDMLILPLEEQEEIWEVARPEMQQFFQIAMRSGGDISKMRDIVTGMATKNMQIRSTNKELGVVQSSFLLPVADMKAICEYKKRSSNDKVKNLIAEIKAKAELWWAEEDLENVFPSEITAQLAEKPLLEYRRNLLRITGEEIQEPSAPSNQPKGSSATDTPPTEGTPDTPLNGGTPDTPLTGGTPETQTRTKSQPFQSSEGLFIPESNGPSIDILDAFDLEEDSIQMMLYDDGRTEYGKLEATRPCRTGNVRFSRFIVNAGTANAPFYRVVRGSDLGPGGAEAFHEEKWQNLYTKFDLAIRKKAMKDIGGNTIKALGPCIEMPRESSTRLTKSGKPYRPDLYVKVEYHKEEAKNPNANSHPIVEWLTRTELSQLVGKKYADMQENVMMARYRKRQLYFNECKKRQLNPETKRPLDPSDFEEYPWLFPEDTNIRKAGSKGAKDADVDMAGVTVDGAEDEDEDEEL